METRQYSKSQRSRLLKIAALGGKQFPTGSLIQEMDKLFSHKWASYRIPDGVIITSDDEDVKYIIRFEKVNGFNSLYTLLAFSCGKKHENLVI